MQSSDDTATDVSAIRQAIGLMPCPAWIADADGRLDRTNGPLAALTGLSAAAMRSDGLAALVHPQEGGRLVEALAFCAAEGRPADVAARIRVADGGHRWHLLTIAPAGDALFVGTAADIDAQVTAVEALTKDNDELERDVFRQLHELNRNRSRLQTIFDTCPDILYLLHLSPEDGLVFEDANRAAELLFSTEGGALRGQAVAAVPGVECR